MPVHIERTDHEDATTVAIGGTLDRTTAPEMRPITDAIVAERRARVIVDLAGLDLIDSVGVAAIVAVYKRVRAGGGTVEVVHARDQPLAILKLLRMDRVFLR